MKKYFLADYLFNYPADIPIEIGSDIAVIPLKPGQDLIHIFDKNDINQESDPFYTAFMGPKSGLFGRRNLSLQRR
jgi:hypothetical protein